MAYPISNSMNNWNQNYNQPQINYGDPQQPKPIVLNTLPVVNTPNPSAQNNPQCIPGRMIHDVAEIAPNEVPMDNTYATFVKDDYKEVFLKTWSSDGTQIKTLHYVLIDDTQPQINDQNNPDILGPVIERLDRIEKRVNQLKFNKPRPKPQQGGNQNV